MSLTDTAIRNAKPGEKTIKMFDGGGLFLQIAPAGGKWWRFKYRFGGKAKLLSLGVYPQVGLKDARDRRDEAKRLLANGIDPSEHRKNVNRAQVENAINGFKAVALEWFTKFNPNWTKNHGEIILRRLERDIFPWLGDHPIKDITPMELLTVLRRIESRGAIETAHRLKQICGQIFRYAIATGRADRDPSGDLRGALAPYKPKHYPTLTDPQAIGELLNVMDGYEGWFVVKCALRLAPLLFVRPGELRNAEWAEIDLERAEWRIPEEKMKARRMHIVPLARQAVEILQDLYPLTRNSKYIFPSMRIKNRPITNNTINAALRRMGYEKAELTGHSFRSMASTILHEQGWNSDVIERQLAHVEKSAVKAAYNHAEYLQERRRMMQAWADYLDELRRTVTGSEYNGRK